MKRIFAILLINIFLVGCGYVELRNEHLKRPEFENQRVFNLTQSTFNFHPSYKVYTVDYETFMLPEDKADGLLYSVKKTYDLFNQKYIITNNKTKHQAFFTDDTENVSDRSVYHIQDASADNQMTIKQKFFDKYEHYELNVATDETTDTFDINIEYNERNEKSPYAQELHSIEMTISRGDEVVMKCFKQQKYFTNRVEIFINDDFKTFSDEQAIALGVCFDCILKSHGISYRE